MCWIWNSFKLLLKHRRGRSRPSSSLWGNKRGLRIYYAYFECIIIIYLAYESGSFNRSNCRLIGLNLRLIRCGSTRNCLGSRLADGFLQGLQHLAIIHFACNHNQLHLESLHYASAPPKLAQSQIWCPSYLTVTLPAYCMLSQSGPTGACRLEATSRTEAHNTRSIWNRIRD